MYYTVYKITNIVNQKIYIGCHKTLNVNDDYMGSGKYLQNSQKKHGLDNFTKEILHVFDNSEDMLNMETMLVNSDFVLREDTYNLKQGGTGGFTLTSVKNGRAITDKILEDRWGKDWRIELSKLARAGRTTESYAKSARKTAQTIFERYGHGTFYGKTHTVEAKQKIGEANSIKQAGSGNSQYGSMWIYNTKLKSSKKINKNSEIPKGWNRGRKIKF